MKKLFLLGVLLLSLARSAEAIAILPDVTLSIVDPTTGLPSETVSGITNQTITLNIDVQDLTGTQTLGGFDFTLSAPANGLTFDGYSNLVSGFVMNSSSGLRYSASANGTANDVTIGATATRLLQATFTATQTGIYTIDFTTPGAFQELSNGSGDTFNYTDVANTLTVEIVPEPAMTGLLFVGLAMIGFAVWKRRAA